MADYDWFDPTPSQAAEQEQRRREEEAEAWRVGFRKVSRSTNVGGFVPSTDFTECLGCGCLIGDREVHRTTCPWTPRVPKTVYVEETK
jgi:hypothetical protein